MIPIRHALLVPTVLLAFCLGIVSIRPSSAQHGRSLPGEAGLEPLTRGAMHEGFARPVAFDPAAGAVVSAEPPVPVDEELPDYRLRGKSVGWMPGYWSWDNHRDQFVWTSGFWRVWPSNRDYVPGYWEQIESGWRRTAGFWVPAGTQKIHYYPAPPKSQEAGPARPPPSADHIWLPGRYVWEDGSFHWRKGFWAKAHLGWIWMPPHHVWTPAGVVYVDGYWDYAVDRFDSNAATPLVPAAGQAQQTTPFLPEAGQTKQTTPRRTASPHQATRPKEGPLGGCPAQ